MELTTDIRGKIVEQLLGNKHTVFLITIVNSFDII